MAGVKSKCSTTPRRAPRSSANTNPGTQPGAIPAKEFENMRPNVGVLKSVCPLRFPLPGTAEPQLRFDALKTQTAIAELGLRAPRH